MLYILNAVCYGVAVEWKSGLFLCLSSWEYGLCKDGYNGASGIESKAKFLQYSSVTFSTIITFPLLHMDDGISRNMRTLVAMHEGRTSLHTMLIYSPEKAT